MNHYPQNYPQPQRPFNPQTINQFSPPYLYQNQRPQYQYPSYGLGQGQGLSGIRSSGVNVEKVVDEENKEENIAKFKSEDLKILRTKNNQL